MKIRCEWCKNDELSSYHDNEWGEIEKDDKKLFELLVLESMQSGLSWYIVLKKREAMRVAFDDFNPKIIELYNEIKISNLMQDDKIIKNRLKLSSLAPNAKAFLKVQKEFGSFYSYIWEFANKKQIKNNFDTINQIPAKTELSDKIAKDMKNRGFKFLGGITIYSFLQACGVIDDHLSYCFKFKKGN